METRIARLDQTPPLLRRAAIILLFIAGASAGLIGRGAARAQQSERKQSSSTKQLVFDAHGSEYKRWLDQDVVWIITPEERRAFLGLSNDQERDEFIRQFWVRRNPDHPHRANNKFKQEHYRRVAFANTRFAAGEPGWRTDRGRVYIVFGPPDSINSHPADGSGSTISSEIWHYRSIRVGWPPDREDWRYSVQPTIIKNFDFGFVDECACGQYRLQSPWPPA